MSEHNLIKVAIQHFVKFGYEGTKLSHIAQEVGMKKQSLYFHFKNKDDLLLRVNQAALEGEIDFLQSFVPDSFKKMFTAEIFGRTEKDQEF